MGNRPDELMELLESVAMQETPAQRVVVVGNGAPLPALPNGVTGLELPENLGVAGGRNAALAHLAELGEVDVVVDLDDDALLISRNVFTRLTALYEQDERLGIISFRICDAHGRTQRRHVPRLRAGDPFAAGHHLSRRWTRPLVEDAEADRRLARCILLRPRGDRPGLAGSGRGMEGALRPALVLQHPWTSPTRHAVFHRMVARNRVWLAKRHLPHRSSPPTSVPGPFSPWPGPARGAGFAPGSEGSPRACARRVRHGDRCGGPRSGA